jgi:hypothetical protein
VTAITCDESHRRPTLRVLAALAVLLGLCAATVLAGASPDPASAARASLIGKTKKTPRPDCPLVEKGNEITRACQAVGRVTGFQAKAGKGKSPSTIPRDGTLVGWSVDLSRPKPSEQRFFEKTYKADQFGSKPTARIAVLRRTKKNSFKLQGQGATVELTEHLGTKQVFTLGTPIRVKKGDVLALTVPTWIPNFATLLPSSNTWRASRSADRCDVNNKTAEGKANLRKSKPQTKTGSTRPYGCLYQQARLLYWGYYVPG